jgi:hypothetical protein
MLTLPIAKRSGIEHHPGRFAVISIYLIQFSVGVSLENIDLLGLCRVSLSNLSIFCISAS